MLSVIAELPQPKYQSCPMKSIVRRRCHQSVSNAMAVVITPLKNEKGVQILKKFLGTAPIVSLRYQYFVAGI
jgi:hypothetical protein